MDTANSEQKIFEHISPFTARFGNILYSYDELCVFDFYGKKAVAAPVFGKKPADICFVLCLKIGQSSWKIAFDSDALLLFHPALSEKIKENKDALRQYAEIFPTELKQALLESLFVPFARQVSQKIGMEIAVQNIEYADKTVDSENCLTFSLQLSDGEEPVCSVLCFAEIPQELQSLALLEALQAVLPEIPRNTLDGAQIPCSLFFCAGKTDLALQELQNLACGDCILLDKWYGKNSFIRIYPAFFRAQDGAAPQFSEQEFMHCAVKDGSAEVIAWTAVSTQKEYSMEQAKDENLQQDTAAVPEQDTARDGAAASMQTDISQIALTVHFCLEERTLTLAELQAVKPGYVFALEQDFLSPVKLVVNGKTVGSGKIVDINGTVGVQVVSVNK